MHKSENVCGPKVDQLEFASKSELVHELLRRWRAESDPTLKQQIGEALRECAAISTRNDDLASVADENLDVIIEVATNGQYANKQIAIPTSTRTVYLQEIESFDPENGDQYQYPWVIRRVRSGKRIFAGTRKPQSNAPGYRSNSR